MTKRREFLKSASALPFLSLPVLGAGSGANAAASATPVQRGGTLVVLIDPEPVGLVHGLPSSASAAVISANLYDGLFEYDENGGLQPRLAERWETLEQGRKVVLHLRRDVQWHDGKPFTAADVQFTLKEFTSKIHPRGSSTLAHLRDVTVEDAHTAILHFDQPSAAFWASLSFDETLILPRHVYEGANLLSNPANTKPVGNGPFVFREWVRGSHVVLERNPNYWDQSGGPYLDRVIFRVVKDPATREAMLETGEAHYAPLNPVPLSQAAALAAKNNLVLERRGFESLGPIAFLDFNLRRPVFQDLRVRQAVAHAINRQRLGDVAWFGFGKPATGPIPSYQKQFYTPDTPQYEFDPEKARALLDQAGYRPDAQGVRLSFNNLPLPYGADPRRGAEFIKQSLKNVGIELELKVLDLAAYNRAVFKDYDFDTNTTWYYTYFDPQIGVTRRYWSQAIKPGTGSSNASGFSDPEVDAIIEAIHSEGDQGQRLLHIKALQHVAQAKLPSVNLLELSFFRVHSRQLSGIDTGPTGAYQSFRHTRFISA